MPSSSSCSSDDETSSLCDWGVDGAYLREYMHSLVHLKPYECKFVYEFDNVACTSLQATPNALRMHHQWHAKRAGDRPSGYAGYFTESLEETCRVLPFRCRYGLGDHVCSMQAPTWKALARHVEMHVKLEGVQAKEGERKCTKCGTVVVAKNWRRHVTDSSFCAALHPVK